MNYKDIEKTNIECKGRCDHFERYIDPFCIQDCYYSDRKASTPQFLRNNLQLELLTNVNLQDN